MRERAFFRAVLFASVAACSSSSSGGNPAGGNSISGTAGLAGWTKIAAAYWIGQPDAVSPPIIMFLFESPMECSALKTAWDSSVNTKVLEIDLWEMNDGGQPILIPGNEDGGPPATGGSGLLGSSSITSPRTFTVDAAAVGTASVAYMYGNYNPEATDGTVTVDRLTPAQNIVGSFNVNFPNAAGTGVDSATGKFDAKWCATGQEP